MDIDNITSIKSFMINRKIELAPIQFCFFFMLFAEKSPEIFPKQRDIF